MPYIRFVLTSNWAIFFKPFPMLLLPRFITAPIIRIYLHAIDAFRCRTTEEIQCFIHSFRGDINAASSVNYRKESAQLPYERQ